MIRTQTTPDDGGARLGKRWWRTPRRLFAQLDARFDFVLDACAAEINALCSSYWTEADDALAQDWRRGGYVFCNWPFSRATNGPFASKIAAEAARGAQIVALGPAAPNARYWHRLMRAAHEVWCFTSRLRYGDPRTGEVQGVANGGGPPFESCIFVFHGSTPPVWGPFLGALSTDGEPVDDAGRAVWRYTYRPALRVDGNRDGGR